jgi:hypothetical protein
MTTAIELIEGSLRLLGQLAEGEVASAETAQDALFAMNEMIESWTTERLMIFSTQDQTFTWPANTISQTLGPSGNFVGLRPVQVDDSTYFKDPASGLSFGIKIINQQQYDGIALKTVTSSYPQVLWLNMTYPDIEMYVYPVPTRALEWHFISVEELTQPATLTTAIAFPPGYLRAFRYNLACELAPEFGVEPTPTVSRIAMTSKRNLKRINASDGLMSMPFAILATRPRYNIYSGNF